MQDAHCESGMECGLWYPVRSTLAPDRERNEQLHKDTECWLLDRRSVDPPWRVEDCPSFECKQHTLAVQTSRYLYTMRSKQFSHTDAHEGADTTLAGIIETRKLPCF